MNQKLFFFRLELKQYQLIGLNWLYIMHSQNINGILADEMGLGKTCQTIAFLAKLHEENPKLRHMIVVPPSTLENWARELTMWAPKLPFTTYRGSQEERNEQRKSILRDRSLNVILTTYTMVFSTADDKLFFRNLRIEYCVFDEAHMLKNMKSIRYQALIKLRSRRKLLLTGTPIQNNIVELMSLLYFVVPDIFGNKSHFLNKVFATKKVS
jgi:SWI/SNF-related matrix-associated actin-dependent regulator 1 of chromatin subfamily A